MNTSVSTWVSRYTRNNTKYASTKVLFRRRLTQGCCVLMLAFSPWLYAQQKSPAEAADSARSFTQGKVLSVKPFRDNDAVHYRVKVLLPNGQVRYIFVDGDNGNARYSAQ